MTALSNQAAKSFMTLYRLLGTSIYLHTRQFIQLLLQLLQLHPSTQHQHLVIFSFSCFPSFFILEIDMHARMIDGGTFEESKIKKDISNEFSIKLMHIVNAIEQKTMGEKSIQIKWKLFLLRLCQIM